MTRVIEKKQVGCIDHPVIAACLPDGTRVSGGAPDWAGRRRLETLLMHQMQDFMRLYSGLVEKCFMACAQDFTSKSLSTNEVCVSSFCHHSLPGRYYHVAFFGLDTKSHTALAG